MNWWQKFIRMVENFLVNIHPSPTITPMTEPEETNQIETQVPAVNPDALLPWTSIENNRHNVRALCDLAGLSEADKNTISQVIHCESNYNPACVHPNIVNGITASTDYGICQINDFYHIGPNKDFETVQYVLDNPEACVNWMIKMFKAGELKLWVCYLKSLYENYSS